MAAALVSMVAACGGGCGGTSDAGTGTLHTSASAAGSEAGWQDIVLSPSRRIDLLSLTNGVLEELGSTPLPAGRYSQVRLVLAENSNTVPLATSQEVPWQQAVSTS